MKPLIEDDYSHIVIFANLLCNMLFRKWWRMIKYRYIDHCLQYTDASNRVVGSITNRINIINKPQKTFVIT